MRKMFKMVSVMLVILLAFTAMLTSCGSKEISTPETTQTATASTVAPATTAADENKIDTSKAVELKLWIVGEAQPDAPKVFDEVNKLSQKAINATVAVQYTTWTDWTNKYNLLFASGEDFDLAGSYEWTGYKVLAAKGAFAEITMDNLNKYCPEIVKCEPAGFFKDAEVNGKMYMIPSNVYNPDGEVTTIRGDLREKYKLEVKTPADYVNYLLTVAKNEKGISAHFNDITRNLRLPLFMEPNDFVAPTIHMNYSLVYKRDDKTGKILKIYELPEYKAYIKTMRDLYLAGAINKDVLSTKISTDDAFVAGKSASMNVPMDKSLQQIEKVKKDHPEWKPEIVDITPNLIPAAKLHLDGVVIPVSSKNLERAMMWENLMVTNKDCQYLLNYGIQGTHYNIVDGKYQGLEGNKNFGFEANQPWYAWNDDLRLRDVAKPDLFYDTYAKWRKAALDNANPVAKVALDDSKIKTEVAACENVSRVYLDALNSGGLDIDKNYDSIVKKYKDAGIDKVVAELQAQMDAALKK